MRIAPTLLMMMLLLGSAAALPALWDSVLPLTTNAANQTLGYGGQRSIAADAAGNLHVVWLDARTVPSRVWYRQYDNTTNTWLPETMLVSLPANCFAPTICCDGEGGRHVAWHVQEGTGPGIWYKRYSPHAQHWMAETLLVPVIMPRLQLYPALACEPGSRILHLAWFGGIDTNYSYQVFHREFRPDSGWCAVEQLTGVSGHQDVGVAADSTGHVCVVWTGYDFPGDYAFVYCRRRISGVWQATELVSAMPGAYDQYRSAIAVGATGYFHIAWYGLRGSYSRVFYRQFTPTRWLDVESVSVNVPRQQRHVSLACGPGGTCHAVWSGQDSATPARHFQLRYSERSESGGWSAHQTLTGIDSGDVTAPTIVADRDSGLHVVWYDSHAGNNDIWYLRGFAAATRMEEAAGSPHPRPSAGPTVVAGGWLRLGIRAAENGSSRISVLDATGRRAAVCPVVRTADGGTGISVAGLRAGLYFAVPDGPRRTAVRFIRTR